jgi:hypothetical protein
MPFTATHIAAILPIAKLWRWYIPFSALAIGSMMPDFPLFFPWGPDYWQMHSIAGAWSGCLPIGVACFLLFQCLAKAPMLAALPSFLQRRTARIARPALEPQLGFYLWVGAGVLIGAYSHILWDSFTHAGRWGTEQLPGLHETWLTWRGINVPGYAALQYGSSVVFLPLMAILLGVWLWRQPPIESGTYPRLAAGWKLLVWLGAVGAVAANVARVASGLSAAGGTTLAFYVVTTSGARLVQYLLAYSVAFHLFTGGKYSVRLVSRVQLDEANL